MQSFFYLKFFLMRFKIFEWKCFPRGIPQGKYACNFPHTLLHKGWNFFQFFTFVFEFWGENKTFLSYFPVSIPSINIYTYQIKKLQHRMKICSSGIGKANQADLTWYQHCGARYSIQSPHVSPLYHICLKGIRDVMLI